MDALFKNCGDRLSSVYSQVPESCGAMFLMLVGALSIARLALKTVSVFAQTFILPGTNLKHFGSGKGSWAVVTGASDGIGAQFAIQLARRGFNIVLVARNHERLSLVAKQIADEATAHGKPVSTKIHVIDFTQTSEMPFVTLAALCKDLEVGVLVNNVGKSHTMPVYFTETPKDEIDDIIKININGTIDVTYAVLPGMIKRKQGLIINIGSFAGAVPSPMLATYSGTKAFLATFSSALAEEVRQHNITVEHVNAFFVVSKLSKMKQSMIIPRPAQYVKSVLAKIGLPCGAAYSGRPNTSTPYWSHALLDFAINLVGAKSLIIRYTHWFHKDIRRRALRKAEREAKKA